MIIKNFFTSGWHFKANERILRNRFQMMNIAIVLSSIAVLYGSSLNFSKEKYDLAFFEIFLFFSNIFLWYLLRLSKKFYNFVSIMVTAQFTVLLVALIYVSSPEDMKHSWYFTYPIIILYLKNEKYAIPWFVFIIVMLLLAPFQPFFTTAYSFAQLSYIAFVLTIVSVIVYFYKVKIDEATELICLQERMLARKVEELTKKDKLLSVQSKQAVMGEMIAMIAHQWRQPLSTVTLSISNLQVKRLLGEKISEAELDRVLENINSTVLYLSDTIDDFQTYFRPDKKVNRVDINELVQKSIEFIKPRLKKTDIVLEFHETEALFINTYANEIIQVLLNIINNAIDELTAREVPNAKISIEILDQEQEILIRVKDNVTGGIDPDTLDSIFEPYYSTKGKNGTGLGLYMSQMIMQKQFHTKIDVVTSEEGSIFTIAVPKKLA